MSSQAVAYGKLVTWLSDVASRDNKVDYNDTITDCETGTIHWKGTNGETVGCPMTGLQFLMENGFPAEAKESIESQYGPISQFPERLEELADRLLYGAKLAREAGIHKTK
ncbi:hypothetical protein T484DRAFT_1757516 [Baffinella frigidus]|nr:hypothetical protein T484DRAFT_1757516 [Cryptophyta sp. CCMP2293]